MSRYFIGSRRERCHHRWRRRNRPPAIGKREKMKRTMRNGEATTMIMKICSCLMLSLVLSVNAPARQSNERASTDTSEKPDKIGPAERNPRYLLRPSDILQITFPITPEFDQSVTVQPDGFVSLRSLGDIHIAGKSLPEVTEMLHKSYGEFLHDPIINIELKDSKNPTLPLEANSAGQENMNCAGIQRLRKRLRLPAGLRTRPNTPRFCCSTKSQAAGKKRKR